SGRAAGPASTAARERGCGLRAGGTPGADRGPVSGRASPGLVEITPRSSARLSADSRSEPAIIASSRARRFARTAASRSASSGLWHDQEPLVLADLDLFDPQGRGHVLVAAGAGQRGGGLGDPERSFSPRR